VDATAARPRWGLGDWFAGFIGAYVAVILLQPVVLAITGQSGIDDSTKWPLSTVALAQVPLYGVMLATALIVTKRKGQGPIAELGLRITWRDVPLGLAAGGVLQLLGNVLYLPLYWFTSLDSSDVDKNARDLTDKAHGTGGVILLLLVLVVAAPIVEEIFYRGLLLRGLERRLGTSWAVVLSSLIFAVSHFELLPFPALFIFGAGVGILAVRTGRLGPGIVAHFAYNATAAYFLLR